MEGWPEHGLLAQIYVANSDAMFKRAVKAGAKELMPLERGAGAGVPRSSFWPPPPTSSAARSLARGSLAANVVRRRRQLVIARAG
jgi:hypothetical protein